MAAPITGVAPIFAISFLGFGLGKKLFSSTDDKNEDLSPSRLFCAGAFSGIFTAIIMVPGERIKCILQVQDCNNKKYDGPISVIKNLYSEGGIRSLYKGTCATLLRGNFILLNTLFVFNDNIKIHKVIIIYFELINSIKINYTFIINIIIKYNTNILIKYIMIFKLINNISILII